MTGFQVVPGVELRFTLNIPRVKVPGVSGTVPDRRLGGDGRPMLIPETPNPQGLTTMAGEFYPDFGFQDYAVPCYRI
jgi:hypothetical protein